MNTHDSGCDEQQCGDTVQSHQGNRWDNVLEPCPPDGAEEVGHCYDDGEGGNEDGELGGGGGVAIYLALEEGEGQSQDRD